MKTSFIFPVSLFFILLFSLAVLSQDRFSLSPGEVKEGWRVFYQKGCFECHSLWGEGGKVGPELTKSTEEILTTTKLAGIMWNHAPEMWHRMGEERAASFHIEKEEMANLFDFLYFVRFMDQPGDVQRGDRLLSEKNCDLCHSIHGVGGKIGADLSKWGNFTNPILWAQMMWNHAPQMKEQMSRKNIPWPKFQKGEMNDLISYIRSVSPAQENVYLSLGNPESGKTLFSQRGCGTCHSVGVGKGIDLTKTQPFPSTYSQMAALMWNHLPKMSSWMEEKRTGTFTLSAQDMADLISYVFSARYFKHRGDKELGRKIFSEKKCDLCHAGESPSGSTDFSQQTEEITPVFLAYAMWNHGQTMLKEMRAKGMDWPKFESDQIENLLEYLNSEKK